MAAGGTPTPGFVDVEIVDAPGADEEVSL